MLILYLTNLLNSNINCSRVCFFKTIRFSTQIIMFSGLRTVLIPPFSYKCLPLPFLSLLNCLASRAVMRVLRASTQAIPYPNEFSFLG